MAPRGGEEEYVTDKLRSYGYLKQDQTLDDELRKRVDYAFHWAKDFEEIKEAAAVLTAEDKKALAELVRVLTVENEPERIQNAIFNVAKACDLQPAKLFKTVYTILLGVPQGPRLGPYMIAMGKQNVIDAFNRVLHSKS